MSRWTHMRIIWILTTAALLTVALVSLLMGAPNTTKAMVQGTRIVMEMKGDTTLITWQNATVFHQDAVFKATKILQRVEGKDVHEFTCTGNPELTDPENRITGGKVIAYSTPRRAEFVGNVKLINTPKEDSPDGNGKRVRSGPTTITSEKLSYDYSSKRAEFTGNVKLVTSPKPEKAKGGLREKVSSDPATITCAKLSYDSKARRARGSEQVVVVQKERTIWADEGVYEEGTELVTLQGNVRMKNTGEEELKSLKDAETVTISLANDWVDIVAPADGVVTMQFEVKDEEEKPAEGGTK